jgi:hypothetical protein
MRLVGGVDEEQRALGLGNQIGSLEPLAIGEFRRIELLGGGDRVFSAVIPASLQSGSWPSNSWRPAIVANVGFARKVCSI